MFKNTLVLLGILAALMASCGGSSSSGGGGGGEDESDAYDMGNPTLSEIYVSTTGNDSNSGTTIAAPLKTLPAAWDKIPDGTLTSTGYRINMIEGSYPCGDDEFVNCTNYFSAREGTYHYPIIIRSVNSAGAESNGASTIRGGMDINEVSYLYLIGLKMVAGSGGGDNWPINNSGNNVLHLASVDHILMRHLTLTGPAGRDDTSNNIQEVIKVNQGEDVYLEDSNVSGTFQTTVDYFSVQTGHFLNNKIYGSGGRCAYLKGGSAYFRIEDNEFYECHEAGFQAGEGSNLNLMRSPWLHYEAYDIKIINNIVHDIYGAGLSVSGGYNILMAYNTLYRVGLSDGRDWTLAQFVQGSRGCPVVDEYPTPAEASAKCHEYIVDGGWGTSVVDSDSHEWIPNKNVYVYNNIFYNPDAVSTAFSHFAVNGPVVVPAAGENIPNPSTTDNNLVFKGNIVWNGHGLELLGTTNGSEHACLDSNPTCTEALILANNSINVFEPELTNPAGGDYTPVAGGNVTTAAAVSIPSFTWDTFTPSVTEGTLSNTVSHNRSGATRPSHPGAY